MDGVLLTVAVNQPPINPPAGFVWDYITLGENDVAAAKQENGNMVLVYLTAKDAAEGALYIYNAEEDSFAPFRQLTGAGATYVLHELPESETAPVGTISGTITIGEQTVSAYVYVNAELADYAIIYLTAADGVSGYYTYDKAQNTLQRYHAVTVGQEPVVVDPEPQVENNPVITFVETYKQVILMGAAACAGLAILIVVIVWIASHSSNGKGKH